MTAGIIDGQLDSPNDVKIPDVYDKEARLGLYGLDSVVHLSVTCDGRTSVISLDADGIAVLIGALNAARNNLKPSVEVAR